MLEQETIFIKMLTPQKPLSVKEVLSIEIPAVEGPYLILPQRAPAMKLLKEGVVVLKDADQEKIEKFFVSAGIAKIRDNACTILAHYIQNVENVDLAKFEKELAAYLEKKEKDIHLDEFDEQKLAFIQMVVGYFAK